jgi:hypothetical protein
MAESEVIFVNPFAVPQQQQGWRGLKLPGSSRRKWYTVLENEFILVTALVVLPGERSIRHYHETGELNISYVGENRPVIRWNPPGVLHGGPPAQSEVSELNARVEAGLAKVKGRYPEIDELLSGIAQRQVNVEEQLRAITTPEPHLRVAIDVLFPPFRTVIDDPAYPGKTTIVGQWYD